MNIHEKLKSIIQDYAENSKPTDSTITAIITAVVERLPGEAAKPPVERPEIKWIMQGWNAYREEVVKVLEEKL